MVDDQDYGAINEDEASRLLKKILSPAEAQSLVPPPPTHAPSSGPGESTPLTGSLAKPPSQATPSRATAKDEVQADIQPSTSPRRGLSGYFAGGLRALTGNARPKQRSSIRKGFLERAGGILTQG